MKPQSSTGDKRYGVLLIAVLLAASLVPFINTLWNHFVYDDINYIVRNPLLTGPCSMSDVFFWGLNWLSQKLRLSYHLLPSVFIS